MPLLSPLHATLVLASLQDDLEPSPPPELGSAIAIDLRGKTADSPRSAPDDVVNVGNR